jgi:hypothetical protein
MEVLETARVDAYAKDAIVVPASKRSQMLCVIWEGACTEQAVSKAGPLGAIDEESVAVWHAGDWTGPISLQPERRLSGESRTSASHDIVALSNVGVKVITIEMKQLHAILKAGSKLYATYIARTVLKLKAKNDRLGHSSHYVDEEEKDSMYGVNVLELLNSNSALKKLNAVQKRHLECLAEGPITFGHGDRMWRAGALVDRAFLILSGSCAFAPKRRNAGSVAAIVAGENVAALNRPASRSNVGDSMRLDAMRVLNELGRISHTADDDAGGAAEEDVYGDTGRHAISDQAMDKAADGDGVRSDAVDYETLSRGLQKRANYLAGQLTDSSEHSSTGDDLAIEQSESRLDHTFTDDEDPGTRSKRVSVVRRRSSRARHANKILGRLYSRHAFDAGLVFSRGHFLGDMSKMVSDLLASDASLGGNDEDDAGLDDAFGEKELSELSATQLELLHASLTDLSSGKSHLKHSSTLVAGKDGCVVLQFTKSNLICFLDEYPGFLLSLLGTRAVV